MNAHQKAHNRILATMAVLLAVGLVLVGQLVRWQILEHETFVRLARAEHQQQRHIQAQRGEIYDRNHFLLAADAIEYEIAVNPPIISDPELTADRLAPVLNIPRAELLATLTSERPWLPLTREAPQAAGETLLKWDITGLDVQARAKRTYPEGSLVAHIIGFVNANQDGFYGIEGYYDSILQGRPGLRQGDRGPFGNVIPFSTDQYAPPRKGAVLVLTVDRTIQFLAERERFWSLTLSQALSWPRPISPATIRIFSPKLTTPCFKTRPSAANTNRAQSSRFLRWLPAWTRESSPPAQPSTTPASSKSADAHFTIRIDRPTARSI
jgi:stage V sporulation protein D (sporulation-specific penicillin-binding protein)